SSGSAFHARCRACKAIPSRVRPAQKRIQPPRVDLRGMRTAARTNRRGPRRRYTTILLASLPRADPVVCLLIVGEQGICRSIPPVMVCTGCFRAALVREMPPMRKPLSTILAATSAACLLQVHFAYGADSARPLHGQEIKAALVGNTLIGADGEDRVSWVYF